MFCPRLHKCFLKGEGCWSTAATPWPEGDQTGQGDQPKRLFVKIIKTNLSMPRNTWKKIIVNPHQLQKKKKKKWHNRGLSKMSFFVSLFKTTLALNVFFLSSLFVHLKNKKTTPPQKNKTKKNTERSENIQVLNKEKREQELQRHWKMKHHDQVLSVSRPLR